MENRNLELLRPFDLESAKAGTLLCSEAAMLNGEPAWKYAAGPDASGRIVAVKISDGNFAAASRPEAFRMAPLCWVEGRPVYKGDVLFHLRRRVRVVANRMDNDGFLCEEGCDSGDSLKNLTWTHPNVKRFGWVNIYSTTVDVGLRGTSVVYPSEELANERADNNRLACARVEWEEPEC